MPFDGVALPAPSEEVPTAPPVLGDRFASAPLLSRAPDPPEASVALVNSRWSGDVLLGELDFFEWPSPLPPPREEVRGDTRPVYQGVIKSVPGEHRDGGELTCLAHLKPQLLQRSRFPLGPRLHSGVLRV